MIDKSTAIKDGLHHKKNVIGVTHGTKITNGVDTGEDCIVVEVKEKVDLSDLTSNDEIPAILSDGKTKTDVIVAPEAFALGVCPSSSGACKNHDQLFDVVKGGTQLNRVAKNNDDSWINWFGTLGGIVRDPTTKKLLGLTNAHVAGITWDSNGYDWGSDSSSVGSSNGSCFAPETRTTNLTKWINHPDAYAGSGNYVLLGKVEETVPLRFNITSSTVEPNYVDAAVFELDNVPQHFPSPILLDSMVMGDHINTAPLFDFRDIANITDEYICCKIGRTTGRTPLRPDEEYVENVTAVIDDADYAVTVRYCSGSTEAEYTASFLHTIKIKLKNYDASTTPSWQFSNSGDSGSLCYIWNPTNDRWEVLGLVFAGSGSGESARSIICRIDYILKQLNVGDGWDIAEQSGIWPNLGSYTFEQFVSGSYLTTLPDVSSSTGLWNGSIYADLGYSDATTKVVWDNIRVDFADGVETVCYVLSTLEPTIAPSHPFKTGAYVSDVSGRPTAAETTGTTCSAFDVSWTSISGNTVFTINGVQSAALHLDRNTVYTFNLSSAVQSAGAHPFKIDHVHPDTGETTALSAGPWSTSSIQLCAGTGTEALSSNWRYYCGTHGADMGNKIYFRRNV